MEQEEEACSSYGSSSLRQCRICHDEEDERRSAMESPCACSGSLKVCMCFLLCASTDRWALVCSSPHLFCSALLCSVMSIGFIHSLSPDGHKSCVFVSRLQYAHRGCVQRWCDEKGSTICEICLQVCPIDRPIILPDSFALFTHRSSLFYPWREASPVLNFCWTKNSVRVKFKQFI
jgi:hypothetical protein